MELPPALREAMERVLDGVPLPGLKRAAAELSLRYRAETRDGRLHVSGDLAARAYAAVRMPATYAAVRAALAAITELRPDFAPRTILDAGAGPGTALWAAADCWPGLADAVLVEASPSMRALGERLGAPASVQRIEWVAADIGAGGKTPARDLVTLAYVLGELAPEARLALVEQLWAHTADMLLIVEPGTPAGWERILSARAHLLAAGARLVAPCPHGVACPLAAPDWCHFARRVARSRLHRLAKEADVPFEDEKYIYLAVSRLGAPTPAARVVARPRAVAGQVRLKLCRQDGTVAEQLWTRRDGERYRAARRLDWGDVLPAGAA